MKTPAFLLGVALVLGTTIGLAQSNEDLPRRQYESGLSFLRGQRYSEALKDFQAITGKLLIVHGLADSNVSPENTRIACRDLMQAKIPFDLMTFDDEGHGIYKAGNREKLLLRIERFFSKAFA